MKREHRKIKKNIYVICDHEHRLIAEVSGPAKPTIRLLWLRFLREFDLGVPNISGREKLFIKWLCNNNGFIKIKNNLVQLENCV